MACELRPARRETEDRLPSTAVRRARRRLAGECLGRRAARWPREGLQASGRIDDVEVPCISPELQISWHVYPEFDDIDWQDVQRLCERFGLDVSPECRERPGFVAAKRGAPFTKRSSEESQRA